MNLELQQALERMPLVAILRGIEPDQCVAVGHMLIDEGFSIIEVPLNSPQALVSIERLAVAIGDHTLIGAGTVLEVSEVAAVASAGGRLVVSPDARIPVVSATRAAGLFSIPGFATVTEAFSMIDAGAHALKLFPAEGSAPQVLKAMRAVLPGDIPILPVGGIDAASLAAWQRVGAAGFGLGSALYRPGDEVGLIRRRARELVSAWRALN